MCKTCQDIRDNSPANDTPTIPTSIVVWQETLCLCCHEPIPANRTICKTCEREEATMLPFQGA